MELDGQTEQTVPQIGRSEVADQNAGDSSRPSNGRHCVEYGGVAQKSDDDDGNEDGNDDNP